MKDLIKRLLSGEGKISLLLLEARELVESSGDESLINFIESEIDGYKSEELPSYRKIKGEIVGTIQTPYGGVQKNTPIGIGKLSEQLGIDVTVAHIFDGVGFIEENLSHLHSNTVNRPLPEDLVESLNHIVQYNNPGITLVSAAHSFGKSGLQHITTKVREELIKGLQQINKNRKEIKTEAQQTLSNTKDKIDVFVTYAWEDENHNDKIISFVDFLRKKGYNAKMDRLVTQEETATNFNKMMVAGIHESDKVIIVLSPKYKEKADTFKGGVGTEYQIILEEIKTKVNKFIFVSFGDNSFETIVPTGIVGRDILDLKKDQDENEFNNLFSKIQSKNVIQFSEVEDVTTEIEVKEIKPFKL